MQTKIAIKSDRMTPLGSIFYAMDEFSRLQMISLIDHSFGLRFHFAGYQYSKILSSLLGSYYCGGDHIENIGDYLGSYLELRSGMTIFLHPSLWGRMHFYVKIA